MLLSLMASNHNNSKNHYNNCAGDKQSNSQTLIPLPTIPLFADGELRETGMAITAAPTMIPSMSFFMIASLGW